MADGISADFSELYRLAADLEQVPPKAGLFLMKALQVTARRVKDDWNQNLYTTGSANRTGHSITYDIDKSDLFGSTVLSAEIGAIRGSGRQAGIDLLLEYGSRNNAPHGAGAGALQKNEADFEHGIDTALLDAEKAAGL